MSTTDKKQTEETLFRFISNGPIQVTGSFVLKDASGKEIESPKEIWLCSCGQSANKPYCDGSHKKK